MDTNELLWWQRAVIYQIYPRSFQDTTGNGIGDLEGVIQRLDYLADLGIGAIWLSPFYPSPMADFGYDVSDYTDVHPMFGDLATFDRLVAEAHNRDIHVIIDFVPDHTSDQHPWFIESRSSRESPKRDWYYWRDPQPDGSPPNNWISNFGGPAWEWDEATRQYYLHSFLKEQPDLNWRNLEVKAAMFGVLRFWLEREVDGFRIDVAHYIGKDPDLRDNPLNPNPQGMLHRPTRDYDSLIHIHDKGHPYAHEIFRELRQLLDAYSAERPRYSVGEIHVFDWQKWASYYGDELDELHMPYDFALLNADWQAQAVRRVVDSLEAAIPPGAWPNYVLGNHDYWRVASRYGEAQARVAAMLLLTLRGTPTVYYGEEIGMTDVEIPPEKQQDPFGLRLPGFDRDRNRTPMQWSAAPNAGFSPPDTAELWLPLSPNYEEVNVEREMGDPTSMLTLYRRLLALRRASPALYGGSYAPLDNVPDACYVYLREADGARDLIALNFSDAEQTISLTEPAGSARVLLSTHLDREGALNLQGVRLRPNEGCIIALL
jgi:alpha-glucosidase